MEFDADVLKLFQMMGEAKLPTIDQLPVRESRMLYLMQSDRLGGPEVAMSDVRDLEAPGPAGAIPLRLYRPEGAPRDGAPVLLFFHGGGWVIGDLDTHDKLCRQIAARAGCLVLAVHYRLAPEHPAPAAADDAIAALEWLAAHAAEIGGDAARIAVGGDSAGGNLAAVCTLAARERGLHLAAQILIYPSVDLRPGQTYPSLRTNGEVPPLTNAVMTYFREKYCPQDEVTEDWRVSPIVAESKSGLAPALVIVAERDALCDPGLAYADALEAAGVPVQRLAVPGMIHGFITMFGVLPAAGKATDTIADMLKSAFG